MNIKICGVYCWTHIPTGRKYVGSSVDCELRRKTHENIIRKGGGHLFHREAAKLGLNNFTFEIVEACEASQRLEREKHHIAALNGLVPNGFNIHKDPTVGTNYFWSEDMRVARSAWNKRRWALPAYRAAHIAAAKTHWSTLEGRKLQSEKAKAHWSKPEVRNAQSLHLKARASRPEVRASLIARLTTYWSNPEANTKASERMKVAMSSPEMRAKLSARAKSYWSSPQNRAAHSLKMKARNAAKRALDSKP